MTPQMPQLESCKVEEKLNKVISSGMQVCSEKSATTFEKLGPVVDNTTAFDFVNSCAELVLLIRICSDIGCFMYSTSAEIAVPSLFFFIVSFLGLIFTFLFIVSYLWNVIRKPKKEDKDHKFEIVFCVTWSMLYGFFTTLVLIFNQPVILPVFCGYLSMICYAAEGYWKCTPEKRVSCKNTDQRYYPIQCYESKSDTKLNTAINLYNKSNCNVEIKNNMSSEAKI